MTDLTKQEYNLFSVSPPINDWIAIVKQGYVINASQHNPQAPTVLLNIHSVVYSLCENATCELHVVKKVFVYNSEIKSCVR
jgi:hypothetical protein